MRFDACCCTIDFQFCISGPIQVCQGMQEWLLVDENSAGTKALEPIVAHFESRYWKR